MSDIKNQPSTLMQLAEELAGISLLESGTVNPFFLLAREKEAYQIPVNFSTDEQYKFTSVKIAAILQSQQCEHYTFTTRIQFKSQAGDKEVMKQQVLILLATKKTADNFSCYAKLYNLKLNQMLGRPQLDFQQKLENFDGQFSNLFDSPPIPEDLIEQLITNIDQYIYKNEGRDKTFH